MRERSLADIWHAPEAFAYNRRFRVTDLQGPCASCRFGRVCPNKGQEWKTSYHNLRSLLFTADWIGEVCD